MTPNGPELGRRVQTGILSDLLLALAPSPVTRLHRAIALRYSLGPPAAMHELDGLAGVLDRYHLYHATALSCCANSATRTRPAPPTASPSS